MTTVGTLYEALQNVGYGGGLLKYISAGQVKFIPYGGNAIRIGGQWYQLPDVGITANNTSTFINGVAAQALAAGVSYNVFLFNNAGTLALDFSTSGHETSATAGNVGTEIKTGDNSRSLVGKIYTDAGGTFANTTLKRWVRSWFNRQAEELYLSRGLLGGISTNSTTFLAIIPVNFLTWQDEIVSATFISGTFQAPAGYVTAVTFWWDGAATGTSYTALQSDGWGNWCTYHIQEHKLLAEGAHSLSPAYAAISGGSVQLGGGAVNIMSLMQARIN